MSQGGDDNDEPACCPGRPAGQRVPAVVERWAGAAEVALRCTACGLAVLAAALLGCDRQARVFFSSYVKVARYTDIRALVLLVIANGIAACYSLVQGARCLVSTVRGSALLNRPLAWAIFSCDQLMAYFTISAVAVALEAAIIGKHGQPEFQWIKTCIFYKRFCAQAGGAVACAVMSSVIMVAVAAMSAFNLFRLYGRGTGRK